MNSRSRGSLVERLISDKPYRDAYVFEHVRNGLAFQLRGIRDALGWSQAKMGKEVGKPQNVISRLEDPNYGRPNLQTLLEIASGLNIGLLVKFVPFTRLVKEFEDVSPEALAAPSIAKERVALEAWAAVEAEPQQETIAQTLRLVDTPPATAAVLQPTLALSSLHLVSDSEMDTTPAGLGTLDSVTTAYQYSRAIG